MLNFLVDKLKMEDRERNSGSILVAAIDFGTTYSGYAYSFKHHFKRDPLQIFSHLWTDGQGLATYKAPTTVLFDKTGTFHSFGYEAENKYAELSSSDNKHIGWKYFRHFKMLLHNQSNLRLNTKLQDDHGKRMEAIKIFSAAIRYLKEHLTERLNESYFTKRNTHEEGHSQPETNESTFARNEENCEKAHQETSKRNDYEGVGISDILWVLTVPAIWSDSAKQFMRLAAVQAGIPENQLCLALEPEAAAIFSIKDTLSRANIDASAFERDSKFVVVDLGGGTVDITVHKIAEDEKFHEIYPPSGGPWGGTLVDEKIHNFIENIFGTKVLEKFRKECPDENLDMLRTLELKKREFKSSADDSYTVNLSLPSSIFEIYEEENSTFPIAEKLIEKFQKSVAKKRGKLQIKPDLILDMFKESIDNIQDHLNTIFMKPGMEDVTTIVMVGGYSECQVLKKTLKESFEDKRVIIPEEASIAVVKGAVIFGHQPDVIDSRKAPCTYGISTAVPFDPMLHSEVHKYHDMCEDVFKVFIAIGTEIIPGKTQVKNTFNSTKSNVVEIYKSILETPAYVTDPGCERIGEIYVDLSVGKSRLIEVTMLFGDTELHVEAKECGTENEISAKFKFLK